MILGPPLIDRPPDGAVSLLLLRVGARRIALRVDELLEEIEVVVRPVRAHGRVAVQHISGAAMLPNGTVVRWCSIRPPRSRRHSDFLPDATPIGPRVEKSAKRKRVLVVDDSITTRTLEASVLEAAGYGVATAFDGVDAWRLLQERGADLVVSDVEMPRMDGLALDGDHAGARDSAFARRPSILVTALETPEHRGRGPRSWSRRAYLWQKSSFEQDARAAHDRACRDLLAKRVRSP